MSEPAAAAFIRGRTVMPFRNSQVDASARRVLAGISEQRRLAVLAGKLWNSGLEPPKVGENTGFLFGIKNQKIHKNQEYTSNLKVNKSALMGVKITNETRHSGIVCGGGAYQRSRYLMKFYNLLPVPFPLPRRGLRILSCKGHLLAWKKIIRSIGALLAVENLAGDFALIRDPSSESR